MPSKKTVPPRPSRPLLRCPLSVDHGRFTVINGGPRLVDRFKQPLVALETRYVCAECGTRAIDVN
jgi:hypothetical protein